MKRKVTTLPTASCVAPADAKMRLAIEHDEDDYLLESLIAEASDWAEKYIDRPIMEQVITYYFDGFDSDLELFTRDISGIIIKYDDENNTEQTLSDSLYDADIICYPSKITADSWPETYEKTNSVRVEVTAGYATEATVPPSIKTAVLLMVGHLYNNREGSSDNRVNELPLGVQSFLERYRVMM